MKVELNCFFCNAKTEKNIDAEGWENYYDTIYQEDTFCPEHNKVYDFLNSVCPGCVGGWSDCTFGKDIQFERITDEDLSIIRAGHCPRRCNGSMTFSREEGMKTFDMSSKASKGASIATVNAITDYLTWCKELKERNK